MGGGWFVVCACFVVLVWVGEMVAFSLLVGCRDGVVILPFWFDCGASRDLGVVGLFRSLLFTVVGEVSVGLFSILRGWV